MSMDTSEEKIVINLMDYYCGKLPKSDEELFFLYKGVKAAQITINIIKEKGEYKWNIKSDSYEILKKCQTVVESYICIEKKLPNDNWYEGFYEWHKKMNDIYMENKDAWTEKILGISKDLLHIFAI